MGAREQSRIWQPSAKDRCVLVTCRECRACFLMRADVRSAVKAQVEQHVHPWPCLRHNFNHPGTFLLLKSVSRLAALLELSRSLLHPLYSCRNIERMLRIYSMHCLRGVHMLHSV